MNGAYTLKGNRIVTIILPLTTVEHCYSKELYKGVIDDRQPTCLMERYLSEKTLKNQCFSIECKHTSERNGSVNSKPELEIYADDVKCSHGSTTGQLDDEAVFYLRSRGLSEKSAKELLVKAFR